MAASAAAKKNAPGSEKSFGGLSISPRLVRREDRGQEFSCSGHQGKANPRGRRRRMRVMVLVKADKDSEAGVMPSEDMLTKMGAYNEELVKAGVMLAMDGLHSSAKGLRMRFSGAERMITDGPFTETKELLAGFWIWQVRSFDEAIEWLKRAPFDGGTEIELRPVFEMEDFGEVLTPELREQEERVRAEAAKLAS
jgi:hypothetical protein